MTELYFFISRNTDVSFLDTVETFRAKFTEKHGHDFSHIDWESFDWAIAEDGRYDDDKWTVVPFDQPAKEKPKRPDWVTDALHEDALHEYAQAQQDRSYNDLLRDAEEVVDRYTEDDWEYNCGEYKPEELK